MNINSQSDLLGVVLNVRHKERQHLLTSLFIWVWFDLKVCINSFPASCNKKLFEVKFCIISGLIFTFWWIHFLHNPPLTFRTAPLLSMSRQAQLLIRANLCVQHPRLFLPPEVLCWSSTGIFFLLFKPPFIVCSKQRTFTHQYTHTTRTHQRASLRPSWLH